MMKIFLKISAEHIKLLPRLSYPSAMSHVEHVGDFIDRRRAPYRLPYRL